MRIRYDALTFATAESIRMSLAGEIVVPVEPVSDGRYVAVSPYGALGAIGWTVLAFIAGGLAFVVAFAVAWFALHQDLAARGLEGLQALPQVDQMALGLYGMLAMQLAIVLVAWLAASRRGFRAADVLALRAPQSRWGYVWAPLLVIAVALAVGNLLYYVMPADNMQDMQLWLPLVNSDYWWLVFIVAAVGAPLSEEVWFRGFLMPSFARTLAGQRPGKAGGSAWVTATVPILMAAVLSAALFALAHVYSIQGAITVLALGLALSFILWRSGSLWTAIVAHAVYNLAVFSYVKWVMPVAELATGQTG
jgi:membrane protease YdiL (CAAX protease family)